jgi:hypothetical protein
MPLTTYTAGEVLTAASLNNNFAAAGGLQFVKAQTIGTGVSAVTVTGAFSATYDAYKIIITGGVASSSNAQILLTFGATSSGYKWAYLFGNTANGAGASSSAAGSSIPIGEVNTNIVQMNAEVFNPFLAKHTYVNGILGFNDTNNNGRGPVTSILQDATSYTAFTLTAGSGTLTGGTIRVYGYANS